MVSWLTTVLNHGWSTEDILDDWKHGIIFPFRKRKGDHHTYSYYGGITLLHVPFLAFKVFANLLFKQAPLAIRDHRLPKQVGYIFIPTSSTIDYISALHLLIEKYWEFHKYQQLYNAAFVNLNAALTLLKDEHCGDSSMALVSLPSCCASLSDYTIELVAVPESMAHLRNLP